MNSVLFISITAWLTIGKFVMNGYADAFKQSIESLGRRDRTVYDH